MPTDWIENYEHFVRLADSEIVPAAERECARHVMPDRYVLLVQPILDDDPLVMVSLSHTDPSPANSNPSGHLLFQSDLEASEVVVSVSQGRSGEHKFERINRDREELGRYSYRALQASDVAGYIQNLVARVLSR